MSRRFDDRDLSEEQKTKALARADLARLDSEARTKAPWGLKQQVSDELLIAYNSGLAYQKIFEQIGRVDYKTVEGWRQTLSKNQGDPFSLADRRGQGKLGSSIIPGEASDIILKLYLNPNRLKVSEVIRTARAVLKTRGISLDASDKTIRNFLKKWKKKNFDIWIFCRHGKSAWNDKCALYIERNYDVLEVGDILCMDGHKLNFEILNPFTGKPTRMILIVVYDMKSNFPIGWAIGLTENTQLILMAVRRAILRLGKLPRCVYMDNGRAFRSRFFTSVNFEESGIIGLFVRLNIYVILSWPYHGQSKTEERFNKELGELERLMPTCVGTDIESKPPRLKRGEEFHRSLYEKKMRGRGITTEASLRFIASWFDEYVQRPQRGHLEGKTPFEVFSKGRGPGVDPKDLRSLLMTYEIKRIGRNGIRFQGKNFYDQALYGRRHPVIIRYDLQDLNSILVYEKTGEFICEAFQPPKVHPAATALGTASDRALLKEQIQLKRRQERDTTLFARDFLEHHVIPEHYKYLEQNGLSLTSPFEPKKMPEIQPPSREEIDRQVAEIENYEYVHKPIFQSEDERYAWLLRELAENKQISEEDQEFIREFEMLMGDGRREYWGTYKSAVGL